MKLKRPETGMPMEEAINLIFDEIEQAMDYIDSKLEEMKKLTEK